MYGNNHHLEVWKRSFSMASFLPYLNSLTSLAPIPSPGSCHTIMHLTTLRITVKVNSLEPHLQRLSNA